MYIAHAYTFLSHIPYTYNCMLESTDLCGATQLNHDHDKISDHHHVWEDFVLIDPLVKEDPIETVDIKRYEGSPQKSLLSKWTYYYHLPNDKTWDLASYKIIMSSIDSLDKLIAINENVTDNIIKNCMLFVMRDRITPMWEDSCNRNGGCFSYKVPNKVVVQVWRDLTYLMCGNALTVDPKHMEYVNGITISPKRGFCIVKVWLKSCLLQDPNVIVNVENLTKAGCLFKNHKAEF